MKLLPHILDKCPKKVRKHVVRTATTLHCMYWGTQAVESFLSASTALYAGLFVLTLLGYHYKVGERVDE